ncbi:MAG TPA: hypothetical protein VMU73_06565 [Gaiellaceae bacterium]|nr:hypothetical protein [Gaiellaceae bacterium]
MKRLLLLSLLAAFALPAQAQAAAPCRDKIYNDWYADGKIASTYPHACYVDALRHIPTDARVYSNLGDDIIAAMRASVRRAEGKIVPLQVGHGFTGRNVLATEHTTTRNPAVGEKRASGGGLVSSASNAPLPLLVLGGLALVLVAAGAIGTGVKYARSRRG